MSKKGRQKRRKSWIGEGKQMEQKGRGRKRRYYYGKKLLWEEGVEEEGKYNTSVEKIYFIVDGM